MHINRFIRPSDKQVEAAAGSVEQAKQRMLDWQCIQQNNNVTRIAFGDFALEPRGEIWRHPFTASVRGLPENTPLNGGEVGATVVAEALRSPEGMSKSGVEAIRYASRAILHACIEADPRRLPIDENEARDFLLQDRQYVPTGYPAIVDITKLNEDTLEVRLIQIGDAYVALHTAGRTPIVLEGNMEARPYNGEIIAGEEKKIDLFKAELKQEAQKKYTDVVENKVSDQFFYDLIFNGTFRSQFIPQHIRDIEAFKQQVIAELRTYACNKYPNLSPEIFDAMIAKGMTPWQQLVAQNNPSAGPFWYPALDGIGDTPKESIIDIRFQLQDILGAAPSPMLTLFTDGSRSSNPVVSMKDLQGINKYGERTELEVEMDGESRLTINDIQK